jgi:hypothetical protein
VRGGGDEGRALKAPAGVGRRRRSTASAFAFASREATLLRAGGRRCCAGITTTATVIPPPRAPSPLDRPPADTTSRPTQRERERRLLRARARHPPEPHPTPLPLDLLPPSLSKRSPACFPCARPRVPAPPTGARGPCGYLERAASTAPLPQPECRAWGQRETSLLFPLPLAFVFSGEFAQSPFSPRRPRATPRLAPLFERGAAMSPL